MILVAIDPGVHTGWARFVGSVLSSCGLGTPPIAGDGIATASDVIVELPEYRRTSRVDPNDLIKLAVDVGGHVAMAKVAGIRAVLAKPSRWKGAVPKAIHHTRIRGALDNTELDILDRAIASHAASKGHNIVDAVGLGLYQLGRA